MILIQKLMKAGKDLLARYPSNLLAEAEEIAQQVPQLQELLSQVKAMLVEIDSKEEIPAEAVQVMGALQAGVEELKHHQTITYPLKPSRNTTMAHGPAPAGTDQFYYMYNWASYGKPKYEATQPPAKNAVDASDGDTQS